MTVFELLAATAGTRIVATRHFVFDNRCAVDLLGTFTGVAMSSCLLVRVAEVIFLLVVTLAALLRSGLLYILLLHLRNLSAHEDADGAVVHVVDHGIPQLHTLQFEDEQRVFLLVAGVLYTVAQFVELSQVLFPVVVDDMEEDSFLEFLND